MKDRKNEKKSFKVSFTKASELKKDMKKNSYKMRISACDAESSQL